MSRKVSTLTYQEKHLIKSLAEWWNEFLELPELYSGSTDRTEACSHINALQAIVMKREAYRNNPDLFSPTYSKFLNCYIHVDESTAEKVIQKCLDIGYNYSYDSEPDSFSDVKEVTIYEAGLISCDKFVTDDRVFDSSWRNISATEFLES